MKLADLTGSIAGISLVAVGFGAYLFAPAKAHALIAQPRISGLTSSAICGPYANFIKRISLDDQVRIGTNSLGVPIYFDMACY